MPWRWNDFYENQFEIGREGGIFYNEVNQSVIHESLNNFEKNGKSDIKR